MIVNEKIALNPYETDINFMDLVSIGDMIIANLHGSQFNLTEGKRYKLLAYCGDLVMVLNDLGNEEWYSVDYFNGH